jgi:outer membrane protein OmpA-like peptidoglycan-associated protein
MCTSVLSAQQVNTLYFLENAPMRHTINPAFQPVSKFYLTLPVIGYTSVWAGTNGWTMSDFIFKGPDGNTITPLHPDAPDNWLDKRPKTFAIDADLSTNLFGFGFRIKKNGYLHINMTERVMAEAHASSSIFGLNDMSSGTVGPMNLGVNAWAYTEYALGYSHKITRQWTVGGKIKVLIGNANVNMNVNNLKFSSSLDSLQVTANGTIRAAAPLNWRSLPTDPSELANYDIAELFSNVTNVTPSQVVKEMFNPAGVGAAFDLGVTYKPIEQLQISASVTDLGFMRWHRLASAEFSVDTTFTGVDLNYGDYGSINDFDSDNLKSDVQDQLTGYANAIHVSKIEKEFPYLNMLTANLNVGIDANFWKNRVGIGVYSRTRFYNSHITEEVTLGAAFRPVNWFNLAASYSFINGKWSNVGAGLSIAPYDGLMLTVATDYIPTTYAKAALDGTNVSLPYKTAGVNVMVGLAIVVGTNNRNKDKDKDGVEDKLDVCPNTPLNVLVTELGCPIDSDGDGVADYQDECPHTSSVAYGFIDSIGCPSDDDRDGVPNYRDECPQTPAEAVGMMAVTGCPLDSDGDGIYDYLDKCPETPAAAYGKVDSTGCPIDTDNDGVYDFLDLCPDTPVEARDMVDEHGCPLDTDKDGVYDYLDECPETPAAARNFVDSVGCFLDTDGDGVYDYEDQCPTIAGVKENLGCPEIKREVRNLLKKAMSGIHFENDKATIKPDSYKILNDIAKVFIENPTYMVEVQGHTDNVGQYDYNIDLSQRRAQAVRTYLINKGVPAERLTAHGYGPARPIDDNNTQAGRAKNRRVEFNIVFVEITYETIYDRVQNNNK